MVTHAACIGATIIVFVTPMPSMMFASTGGERVELRESGIRLFDPAALKDSLP